MMVTQIPPAEELVLGRQRCLPAAGCAGEAAAAGAVAAADAAAVAAGEVAVGSSYLAGWLSQDQETGRSDSQTDWTHL